ncbi:hypothetical protein GJJ64_04595 [Pedobacter sp. HX-22-1]|jgi:hypothetical protein|uniref:Uncharacterized protein n=1 Tax=Pedobacter puniceum TaxID=2666136 RepID=A0A7K0FKG4_9SPHI|nr:hypothetical protein [Pedobacter puniceum]
MRFLFTLITIILISFNCHSLAIDKQKQSLLLKNDCFSVKSYFKKYVKANKLLTSDINQENQFILRKNARLTANFNRSGFNLNFENNDNYILHKSLITSISQHYYISQLLFPFHSFLEKLS